MRTWIAAITAASSAAITAAQAITADSNDAAIMAAAEKCKAARIAAHLDAMPQAVSNEIAAWRRWNQDPMSGRNRQGHPACDGPEGRAALAEATNAACGFDFPRGGFGLRRAWGAGCPVPESLCAFTVFAAAESLGRIGSALERCLETWSPARLTWRREILDWITPRLSEIAASSGVQAARRRLGPVA